MTTFPLSNLELITQIIERSDEVRMSLGTEFAKIEGVIGKFFQYSNETRASHPSSCVVCIQETAAFIAFSELYLRENGSLAGTPFVLDPMRFCDATWRQENVLGLP